VNIESKKIVSKEENEKEKYRKNEKLDKCPKKEKDCQDCIIEDCPEEEI
jgi:hypothetical protein